MDDETASLLTGLPENLLEHILLLLDVQDVVTCSRVCLQLKDAALRETLWWRMCSRRWPQTEHRKWLTRAPFGHFQLPESPHNYPGTFRDLYPLLQHYEHLIGVWSSSETRGLFVFAWAPDCIQGAHLVFDSFKLPPLRSPFLRMAADGVTSVEVMRSGHCWLREYRVREGRLAYSPCDVAEAAAAVAAGSHIVGDSSKSLGSSPQGSFEFELLRFMQASVSGRRRKSRSRSPGQGMKGSPEVLSQHHLRRVPTPLATRAHPLTGLWKGDFMGRAGVQIISISYYFKGPAAIIRADKVTGDALWPAGETVWWAMASALPTPHSDAEVELMTNRMHLLNMQEAAHAMPLRLTSGHSDGPVVLDDKDVVACYLGKGRVAGLEKYVEGRLWQYRDGDIGFLWIMDDDNSDGVLADFKRIDADLQC